MFVVRRSLVTFGAFALGARLVLACGTILRDEDVDVADANGPEAGTAPDADGGSGSTPSDLDGAPTGEPDVVSQCRTAITDDFEASSASQDQWQEGSSDTASISHVSDPALVKHGAGAVLFEAPTNGFAQLATPITGKCPLTIDFWVMRKAGVTGGVIFFELVADGRIRQLRQSGQNLHLDYESQTASDQSPTLQVSTSFFSDTYYHLVITYEVSGKMTVKVDDAAPVLLKASATEAAATGIRFGALGSTGEPPSTQVLFDDVFVY